MLSRPTVGEEIPSIVPAYSVPMMPNSNRCLGLQSTLAPASTSRHGFFAVGISAPMVGRPTFGSLPRINVAAERTAPVFPALTNASARPFRCISSPTEMEESFLDFTAAAGASLMSMTSAACSTAGEVRPAPRGPAASSSAPMRSRSPTRITENAPGRSLRASRAPRTTQEGAKSPPIASTTTRISEPTLVNDVPEGSVRPRCPLDAVHGAGGRVARRVRLSWGP